MEVSESRVMGALILLLGVSFLAVGVYTGQVSFIINLLKQAFP